MDKLYYGGIGSDDKVLVYDQTGKYKNKWPAQKVFQSRLEPITRIKAGANCLSEEDLRRLIVTSKKVGPETGLDALYLRRGKRVPVRVIAVTDKAMQLATFYSVRDGKVSPCKYYEISRSQASDLITPARPGEYGVPCDPPTGMDEWRIDFHDDPLFVPGDSDELRDDGYSFTGDVLHLGKKVGTISCVAGQRESLVFEDAKYLKDFKRSLPEWFQKTGLREEEEFHEMLSWWVAFYMEELDNLAITATEFFKRAK